MATKNNIKAYHQLIFTIIFLINFNLTISERFFNYPNAIKLKTGNIFIIHKEGVTICDSSYKSFNDIIIFNSTEQINESDLSKVTISQFDDGYIVSVIINHVYIFDANGVFKFKGTDGIFINNVPDDLYYSIAIHKIESNKYYYLLSFVFNELLYFQYYEYDSEINNNEIIIKKYEVKDRYYHDYDYYTEHYIKNKGLSCEFLKKNSQEIITCAYYMIDDDNYPYLSIAFLCISGSSIIICDYNIHRYWTNIKLMESLNA